ncbi:hypothetical protein [Craurococcus roseus]|uniref:hypothetical protein n=1 Tax=Craurococcus roseus TaxID=77585 RepID=UPI0031DAC221
MDVLPSGIIIQITDGTRLVRMGELDRWVVQDVPIALLRRIESSLLVVPAAHLARLRDQGFDVSGLIRQQARLAYAVIEAVDTDREAVFEGVEAVGHMLGTPAQHCAAQKLLEAVMALPFVKASGGAHPTGVSCQQQRRSCPHQGAHRRCVAEQPGLHRLDRGRMRHPF